MRVEGSAIASPASAGQLQKEMADTSRGLISEAVFSSTWDHEMAHFYSDPERSGEFGYQLEVEVTAGVVIASWICYYMPFGERDPEDLMEIAKAPGLSEMSSQDKLVYEAAYQNWILKMEEEKSKIREETLSEELSENKREPSLPVLEVIPIKADESEDEYSKRQQIVIIFGKKIEELSENGKIPTLDAVLNGSVVDFLESNYSNLIGLYLEAVDEAENKQEEEMGKTIVQDTANETDSITISGGGGEIFVTTASAT